MYRLYYRLRILLTIAVALGIAAAIFYYISYRDYESNVEHYHLQITAAVATAVQSAVFDVTRTAEAPGNVFRIVRLGQNEDLEALAAQHGTTLEILQVVNSLGADVVTGNGETIVVPVGLQELEPLRTIVVYTAEQGDTLESLADRNRVPLEQLQADNPMLAQRGLRPGDTVFIGLQIL
ncbi:MAG: hypothetical protein CL610_21400 [Anaerolineaceae bacterium]|nr:hypothetical protein [Anaerolineaceae bacterium]